MTNKVKRESFNVTSQLETKLLRIQEEANLEKEKRGRDIIEKADKSNELAIVELEDCPISDNDKRSYIYSVKPQLNTLRKMIEAGMPSTHIADALQVSHASLMRLKEHVPAVAEIFYLGERTKVELAQESIFQLAQSDVIEEQALTRDGEVVTLQKVVRPDFRAAKYIVEHHMPEVYSSKQVIEHTTGIHGEKLNEMLGQLTPEMLEAAISRAEAIDAEYDITEKDEVSQ